MRLHYAHDCSSKQLKTIVCPITIHTKTIYFGGGRRFSYHLGVTRTVAHDYLCFAVVIEDVSSIWYSRFALGT